MMDTAWDTLFTPPPPRSPTQDQSYVAEALNGWGNEAMWWSIKRFTASIFDSIKPFIESILTQH